VRLSVLLSLVGHGCRARGRDRACTTLFRAVLQHGEENRLEWLVPGGRHGEAGGVAGHAARGVADDDRELVAVVGSGGRGCGVAGGGGSAARRAALLPLVAQVWRARDRDREG